MNFAFVITNLAGGGAEKVILILAEGLARRGHQAEVILCEDRIEHKVPDGIRISVLSRRFTRGWLGKRWLAWRLRRHLLATGKPPDLIVSALPFANEIAILANLPHHWCRIDNTLGAEIDRLALGNPAKAERRLRRYRRLFNSRPLISISDGMTADLRQRIGISSRIEQIPNPFDFGAIRQAAQAAVPELPKQPYVIHVGRFNAVKRHDLLLDAWARMGPADHLLVLLAAPDPRLQAMIDEHGLTQRVWVAGFQPNPYPWIAGAELLVLSSDHEGLPGVLIEALACGTRVVSTDCPSGPREILAGELSQGLVPCNDVDALAGAMSVALTKPRPSGTVIGTAIAPYDVDHVLAAWERLAAESSKLP
jgi:glycosyltransferase involved in cell wall biosynthesis